MEYSILMILRDIQVIVRGSYWNIQFFREYNGIFNFNDSSGYSGVVVRDSYWNIQFFREYNGIFNFKDSSGYSGFSLVFNGIFLFHGI